MIEANKKWYVINKHVYLRRQAIVEHPYGIIKRQWGYSYIMTKKSIKRASADVELIFVVYNLRRIMNILGQDKLKAYLKTLSFVFRSIMASNKAIFQSRFFNPQKLVLYCTTHISNHLPNFNRKFSLKIAFDKG
jgi:hypothetical protein